MSEKQEISNLRSFAKRFHRKGSLFLCLALSIVAADQLTKYIVKTNMALGQSIPEGGFFHFTYVQNTGAAFSILREHTFLLSIFSIIGVVLLLFITFYLADRIDFLKTTPAKLSLGLIMGGTVGNLIDRLSYGYVIDFIDFDFFATFNIADSAITVGVLLLAFFYIRSAGN
jgi:signal peptidase II